MNTKCASSNLFHEKSRIATVMITTLPSDRMQHHLVWGTSNVYKPAASTSYKTFRTIQHHISENQEISAILVT